MKLFIYDNYRDLFPDDHGQALTDQMILHALAEYGADTCGARVERTDQGKPMAVLPCDRPLHVSVSHSRDTFGCVIGENNCGLDIQEPRTIDHMKVAKRFYNDTEINYVEEHGADGFYRLWTRKEAFAKFTGRGLRDVLGRTSVIDRSDVCFEERVIGNGMYCCVCTACEGSI